MAAPMRIFQPGAGCGEEDCQRKHYAYGLCEAHLKKYRRAKNPKRLPVSLIRDAEGRKQCKACLRWLIVDSFTKHKLTADGLFGKCRPCRTLDSRVWHLKKNFDMTLEDELTLRHRQDNRCAICRGSFNVATPHVDHDHACCPTLPSCGQCVRGLLCSRCNQGLGLFADSVEALVGAIAYLKGNSR